MDKSNILLENNYLCLYDIGQNNYLRSSLVLKITSKYSIS